jgi:hypothetical protein
MSNYTKATNFASKDSLPTGNAGKIVKGTEIDDEFNAIATAVATKADLASPSFTGTPTAPTAASSTNTTQIATTAFVRALPNRIAQIVTFTTNSQTSTTGTSFTNSALTASITPSSTSSKILIIVSASQRIYDATTEMNTRIVRGASTEVAGSYKIFKAWLKTENAGQEIWVPSSMTVIDSPSTTSSTTYTVQLKAQASTGGTVTYGSNDTDASIIVLMEILQ